MITSLKIIQKNNNQIMKQEDLDLTKYVKVTYMFDDGERIWNDYVTGITMDWVGMDWEQTNSFLTDTYILDKKTGLPHECLMVGGKKNVTLDWFDGDEVTKRGKMNLYKLLKNNNQK